jgi:hypothetical protein
MRRVSAAVKLRRDRFGVVPSSSPAAVLAFDAMDEHWWFGK